MNIKDEGEILAIRVDQNNGAYFRAFVGQNFEKSGFKITEIYQDLNDLVTLQREVYKVRAKTKDGIEFIWQKFSNSNNVQITNKAPNISDLVQINQLFEDGW